MPKKQEIGFKFRSTDGRRTYQILTNNDEVYTYSKSFQYCLSCNTHQFRFPDKQNAPLALIMRTTISRIFLNWCCYLRLLKTRTQFVLATSNNNNMTYSEKFVNTCTSVRIRSTQPNQFRFYNGVTLEQVKLGHEMDVGISSEFEY